MDDITREKLLKIALGYDLPLTKIVDTLVLSQLLLPELKVPEGWVGKPKPHSVEAWGMRFRKHKPEHEDWSRFSPEMLFRCEQDVLIQEMILDYLEKEASRE